MSPLAGNSKPCDRDRTAACCGSEEPKQAAGNTRRPSDITCLFSSPYSVSFVFPFTFYDPSSSSLILAPVYWFPSSLLPSIHIKPIPSLLHPTTNTQTIILSTCNQFSFLYRSVYRKTFTVTKQCRKTRSYISAFRE